MKNCIQSTPLFPAYPLKAVPAPSSENRTNLKVYRNEFKNNPADFPSEIMPMVNPYKSESDTHPSGNRTMDKQPADWYMNYE